MQAASQLDPLDIDYEFFPALNGAEGLEHFAGIDSVTCFLSLGRQPSDGEIGCYASHLGAWKKCVALGRPILVLEDDFYLLDGFNEALELASQLVGRYGFIRLESLQRGRFRKSDAITVGSHGRFQLHYLRRVPLNATAYALSPAVATQLIAASERFTAPLDNFLQRNWVHKQAIFVLTPETVDLHPVSETSSIVEQDRNIKSLSHRAARLARLPYKAWSRFARSRIAKAHLRACQSGDHQTLA